MPTAVLEAPPIVAPVVIPLPALPLRPLKAADLDQMPSQLRSGPIHYELHNGVLAVMPPAGDIHCAVESSIAAMLKIQGEWAGHGKVRSGDGGILLRRAPDHLLCPDAAFISNDRLPLRHSREGYLETIPDLIVEVRSKNDSVPEVARKAQEYLDAGVRLVWVPDPFTRTVREYRPGAEVRTYAEADTLTAEDVIPGFRMAVSLALQE